MRIRLFEFGDQAWYPDSLRNYGTDYLETLFRVSGAYSPAVPLIAGLMKQTGSEEIVDLCSGAGGPILPLVEPLGRELGSLRVRLTDKFPNLRAFERLTELSDGVITGEPNPVDVFATDHGPDGLRTMFDALHHFEPEQVGAFLRNLASSRRPIAIFDAVDRSAASIAMAVFIPIFVLLATPAVRPFRWTRLLWTYAIPILPLLIFWDGLVSHMRGYRERDLQPIVGEIADYTWQVGRTRPGLGGITYVLGLPSEEATPGA